MRRVRRTGISSVLCALAFGACLEEITVDEGAPTPVLIGIAVTGIDSVFVSLGRSGPGTSAGPEPEAALRVGTPSGTVPLVEADPPLCEGPAGYSCYVGALARALEPGDRVTIEGRLRGGQQVDGETVVPPVPSVDLDGAGAGDTLRVASAGVPSIKSAAESGWVILADSLAPARVWVAGAVRECRVTVTSPRRGIDLRTRSPMFPLLVSEPECDGARVTVLDSMAVELDLLGLDRHGSAWREVFGDRWPSDLALGVEGVLGVFGSATVARVFILYSGS